MKYISLSLYGDKNRYCVGAIKNAILLPAIYPGWRLAVFHDESVPVPYLETLAALGVVLIKADSRLDGLFWRFLANDIPGMTRFVVRDADSRISHREAEAVTAWELSGRQFHSMRDHPAHIHPINGGMWGAVAGLIPNMGDLVTGWFGSRKETGRHDPDQEFLAQAVWPLAREHSLQHDSFYRQDFRDAIPFPSRRTGQRFVGEVVDANDIPREGDYSQVQPDS